MASPISRPFSSVVKLIFLLPDDDLLAQRLRAFLNGFKNFVACLLDVGWSFKSVELC